MYLNLKSNFCFITVVLLQLLVGKYFPVTHQYGNISLVHQYKHSYRAYAHSRCS